MKTMAISTLVLATALVVTSVSAREPDGPLWLKGDAISRALDGKTIEGRYASGRAFTERYLNGGRVEYIERGQTIGGHWSVTSGTLCTIYDTDPTGGCFRVAKVGANCFEFYFVTRTEEAAPGPEGASPKWTARGSVSGEPVACQDAANV